MLGFIAYLLSPKTKGGRPTEVDDDAEASEGGAERRTADVGAPEAEDGAEPAGQEATTA